MSVMTFRCPCGHKQEHDDDAAPGELTSVRCGDCGVVNTYRLSRDGTLARLDKAQSVAWYDDLAATGGEDERYPYAEAAE